MEPSPQEIAQLLRKPEGDAGKEMAFKMNDGNAGLVTGAINQLSLREADRVLEIGFGNGKHLKEILEKADNIKYEGVDISETMVNEANDINSVAVESKVARFQLGEVSDLPFEDDSFEKVFTCNTIYFWPAPEADIKELFRVLKPEGTLVIGFREGHTVKDYPFIKFGFQLYEQSDVQELLQSAGFRNVSFKMWEEHDSKWKEEESEKSNEHNLQIFSTLAIAQK